MNKFSLSRIVTGLEDGIIILSGPALAISGIIAGVDLVTGGHLLQQAPALTMAWAITLLLTLDFQVLALGVRGMRVYQSNKHVAQRCFEIGLIFAIAGGISLVSIQMQSIIARLSAEGITVDQAAAQLGISMLALTWERSILVLVLIFLSGWLREAPTNSQGAIHRAPTPPVGVTEEAAVNAPARDELPEHAQSLTNSRIASKRAEIARALQQAPGLTAEELAAVVGCSVRTAEKWRRKHHETLDTAL
jgi:hypothetical protein